MPFLSAINVQKFNWVKIVVTLLVGKKKQQIQESSAYNGINLVKPTKFISCW